jgi:hypothetical protein
LIVKGRHGSGLNPGCGSGRGPGRESGCGARNGSGHGSRITDRPKAPGGSCLGQLNRPITGQSPPCSQPRRPARAPGHRDAQLPAQAKQFPLLKRAALCFEKRIAAQRAGQVQRSSLIVSALRFQSFSTMWRRVDPPAHVAKNICSVSNRGCKPQRLVQATIDAHRFLMAGKGERAAR